MAEQNPFLKGRSTTTPQQNPFLKQQNPFLKNKNPFLKSQSSEKPAGLDTVEGLVETAKKAGIGPEAEKIVNKKPTNRLMQLLDLLSRGNYASANVARELFTDKKPSSPGDVGRAFLRGVRGQDKTTYSQVLDEAGVKNKYVKAIGGFVGDVVLDPTTYIGAGAAKAGLKGTTKAGQAIAKTKVGGKVAESVVQPAKDALGKAFVYGYGTTKGLADDVTRTVKKLGTSKQGIAESAIKRFKGISSGDEDKIFKALTETRVAELTGRKAGSKSSLEALKNEAKKYKSAEDFVKAKTNAYHGTNADFSVFDPKKINTVEKAGDYAGSGFYFTDTPERAGKYADQAVKKGGGKKNIIEASLDIKNPLVLKNKEDIKKFWDSFGGEEAYFELEAKNPALIKKELIRRGYDGVVDRVYGQTAVFEPGQIKTKSQLTDLYNQSAKSTVNFADQAVARAKELGATDNALARIKGELERAKKFAKNAGVENPYEAYFPFLKKENLKQVEQATGSLKVGSEGYLKQFQAKLKPDEIINSVPEAYARREYQVVRDKITRDSLESFTKRYGKQFASEEEAVANGYRALKEKGQFGKVVGYLKEADKKFVDELFNPEFATIDKLAKATKFDDFNRVWKTSVTKYFPAFHARNWASGLTQNYEVIGREALNPKTHQQAGRVLRSLAGKQSDGTLVLGKKVYKTKEIAKAFQEKFGRGDWKNIADLGDTIASGRAPLKLGDYAQTGWKKINKPFDTAGEWVESQQKMVAFIGSLKQNKTIQEALEIAEKAGFDYSKVTGFEAKVLRRIIPFYTFTRKNLELQAKTLAKNPERIANIGKGFRAGSVAISGDSASEEELAGLPDFVQQGLNIRTGKTDKYGRPLYATAGGTALEAATQQVSGNIPLRLVSQSNPVLKFIFEKSTGIDTFRSASGEMIKTADVRNADKYADAPEVLKGYLKLREVKKPIYADGKKVGERTGYEADPDRLRVIENLPTSRLFSTIANIYALSGKAKNAEGKTASQRVLDLLSGAKTYPVDVEQQGYFKQKRQREALTTLLEKAGILKTFELPYVPKK